MQTTVVVGQGAAIGAAQDGTGAARFGECSRGLIKLVCIRIPVARLLHGISRSTSSVTCFRREQGVREGVMAACRWAESRGTCGRRRDPHTFLLILFHVALQQRGLGALCRGVLFLWDHPVRQGATRTPRFVNPATSVSVTSCHRC